jgi:hypothetical protein
MERRLFIVSRGRTETYEQLRRALIGEPEVEIIYDRRDPASQEPRRKASSWSRAPLDRRTPSHADIDLRVRGWVMIGGRADPGLEISRPLAPPTSQHHREGTGAARPEMRRTGTRTQPRVGARLSFWLTLAVLVLLNIAVFIIIIAFYVLRLR